MLLLSFVPTVALVLQLGKFTEGFIGNWRGPGISTDPRETCCANDISLVGLIFNLNHKQTFCRSEGLGLGRQCTAPPRTTATAPPSNPNFNLLLINEWSRYCRGWDDNPYRCRYIPECTYICSDGRCDVRQNFKALDQCTSETTPVCHIYCFDPLSCKLAGCEYNVAGSFCRDGNQVCPGHIKFEPWECIRKNTLYARGGEICTNYADNKDSCIIAKVITAVNLNGEKITDHRRKITYEAHADGPVKVDPYNLEKTHAYPTTMIYGVPDHLQDLFRTAVGGSGNHQLDRCLSYQIPIDQDGNYAITLKLVEHEPSHKDERHFNVRLNNLTIVPELNLVAYTGIQRYGVDLIISFRILNGRTKLHIIGFPTEGFPITPGQPLLLSFCFGDAPNDLGTNDIGTNFRTFRTNFVIPGFDVVRFKDPSDAGNCTAKYLNYNPCHCNEMGCRYSTATFSCLEPTTSCSVLSSENPNECRRANAYYSNGGILCKNPAKTDSASCQNARIGWAVNLNGNAYVDARGVPYVGESSISDFVKDPDEYRVGGNTLSSCPTISGVSAKDASNLYASVVSGNPQKKNCKDCLSYPIPICKDGIYELSLKFVEDSVQVNNNRSFNIRLDHIVVVPEVNLLKLAQRCTAIEIIIIFEVHHGAVLRIRGYPDEKMSGDLELKLCYSECSKAPDLAFQMSAYSVLRLSNLAFSIPNECFQHNGNPCKCKVNPRCEYNVIDNYCMPRKNRCSLCNFGLNECRRANTWYSDGAVLCKNIVQRGECTCEKPIIGVNFAGQHHVDRNGIAYEPTSVHPPFRWPSGTRYREPVAVEDIKGKVDDNDIDLYRTFASAVYFFLKDFPTVDKTCAAYKIRLEEDGHYELALKMGDFYYSYPGSLSMNVKFNGVEIVKELDVIVHSGEKFGVMDLSINFRVAATQTTMILKGHPPCPIIKREALLEFCYGGCHTPQLLLNSLRDPTWRISAFSLIKLVPPGEKTSCGTDPLTEIDSIISVCQVYNGNPCGCRKARCDYNVATQTCLRNGRKCPECEIGISPYECRRSNSYYLNGGVLCKNDKRRGRCSFTQVVIAVNFHGGGHEDRNGIQYSAYNSKMPDILPSNVNRGTYNLTNANIPQANRVDKALYESVLWSTKPGSTQCLTYNVPIPSDGSYELQIKAWDGWHGVTGKRTFSYKLNGVFLTMDLDLIEYSGATGGIANTINLVVNFEVKGDKKTLYLPGYPQSTIVKGNIAFEACPGSCTAAFNVADPFEQNYFVISAFSIVKFGLDQENDPTCAPYNKNACECVRRFCQFNSYETKCLSGLDICQHKFGSPHDCRRTNSFYSDGGALCRNEAQQGACSQADTTYALNVFGNDYQSSTGIFYQGQNGDHHYQVSDPDNVLTTYLFTCKNGFSGATPEDADKLYKCYVGGHSEKRAARRCVTIKIPICQDGRFELSIKAGEEWFTEQNKRRFNVRFAGKWIFNEIDLIQLAGRQCKRVEVISLFEIDDDRKVIRIQGFPDKNIANVNEVNLDVCYGECSGMNGNFQFSAVSVVRFGEPLGGPPDPCTAHDNNPCQCTKAQCAYFANTRKCRRKKLRCSTCEFKTKKLCGRKNAYYLDEGNICRMHEDKGNCKLDKVILAVNMGGPQVKVNDITFKAYNSSLPSIIPPDARLSTATVKGDVPAAEKPLYETVMWVNSNAAGAEKAPCVVYNIPITESGYYELSIWLWEYHSNILGARTFNIRLNGHTIIQEIDMNLVAGIQKPFKLIVNFEVIGTNANVLKMKGYHSTSLKSGRLTFEICRGYCTNPPILNGNLSFHAFSIIKFQE